MIGSLECYFFANDNTYTNLPFFFGREEFLYSSTAGEHSIYCFQKNSIKKIDKIFLPEDMGMQSDWDEQNEHSQAFIQNKPFGHTQIEFIPKNTYQFFHNNLVNRYSMNLLKNNVPFIESPVPGEKYTVVFDGITYPDIECKKADIPLTNLYSFKDGMITWENDSGMVINAVYLGNPNIYCLHMWGEVDEVLMYNDSYKQTGPDTTLPFCIANGASVSAVSGIEHEVYLFGKGSVKTIDKIFLPPQEIDWEHSEEDEGFIKNKPFGILPHKDILEPEESFNLFGQTYQFTAQGNKFKWTSTNKINFAPYDKENLIYLCSYDLIWTEEGIVDPGISARLRLTTYKGTYVNIDTNESWEGTLTGLGNPTLWGAFSFENFANVEFIPNEDQDCHLDLPFFICEDGVFGIDDQPHNLHCQRPETIKKIDKKYLPDGIGTQSDWNETDENSPAYIQNKPTIFDSVQADWNETDENSQAYIKNKPTSLGGGAGVQSDWEEQDSESMAFIKNKPTITEPVQSDWNEKNAEALSFIKNKPSIPEVKQPDWDQMDDDYIDFIKNKPFGYLPDVLANKTYTFTSYSKLPSKYVANNLKIMSDPEVNKTYIVIYDGQTYEVACNSVSGHILDANGKKLLEASAIGIGNPTLGVFWNQYGFMPSGSYVDYPFYISMSGACAKTSGNHSLYCRLKNNIKTIDKIFLPEDLETSASQSDWNETDSTKSSFILNKPIIQQANWNQTDSTAPDYIHNKPESLPQIDSLDYNKTLKVNKVGKWELVAFNQPDAFTSDMDSTSYIKNKLVGAKEYLANNVTMSIKPYDDSNNYFLGTTIIHFNADLVPGYSYTLSISSKNITAIAKRFVDSEGGHVHYLGNLSLLKHVGAYEGETNLPVSSENWACAVSNWFGGNSIAIFVTTNYYNGNYLFTLCDSGNYRTLHAKYLPIDNTMKQANHVVDAKTIGNKFAILQNTINEQSKLISSLQDQIDYLLNKINNLGTNSEVTVDNNILITKGNVINETLELESGQVTDELLTFEGSSSSSAAVIQEELSIEGVMDSENEILTLSQASAANEILEV